MLVKRSARAGVARVGAGGIAAGVAVDLPAHAWPDAGLDALALIGHLIVLGGMALVLVSVVLAALASPSAHTHRRFS